MNAGRQASADSVSFSYKVARRQRGTETERARSEQHVLHRRIDVAPTAVGRCVPCSRAATIQTGAS